LPSWRCPHCSSTSVISSFPFGPAHPSMSSSHRFESISSIIHDCGMWMSSLPSSMPINNRRRRIRRHCRQHFKHSRKQRMQQQRRQRRNRQEGVDTGATTCLVGYFPFILCSSFSAAPRTLLSSSSTALIPIRGLQPCRLMVLSLQLFHSSSLSQCKECNVHRCMFSYKYLSRIENESTNLHPRNAYG